MVTYKETRAGISINLLQFIKKNSKMREREEIKHEK